MSAVIEDAEAYRLRHEVIRLIHQLNAAWELVLVPVGKMGPATMVTQDPEALKECDRISRLLQKAIVDYTLHMDCESGPVRYRGKIFLPIESKQRRWTCVLDLAEVRDIADDEPPALAN